MFLSQMFSLLDRVTASSGTVPAIFVFTRIMKPTHTVNTNIYVRFLVMEHYKSHVPFFQVNIFSFNVWEVIYCLSVGFGVFHCRAERKTNVCLEANVVEQTIRTYSKNHSKIYHNPGFYSSSALHDNTLDYRMLVVHSLK